MKAAKQYGIFFLIFYVLICIEPSSINAQMLDISQITAEKYIMQVDEKEFVIYYGFAGSMEIEIEKDVKNPKIISMEINSEKKSLEINFEKTPETSLIWFRLPTELISAEGEKFNIFVNGIEEEYDLVRYEKDYRIGILLDKNTENVEIIGTSVIPEFGGLTILILSISIIGIISIMRSRTLIK